MSRSTRVFLAGLVVLAALAAGVGLAAGGRGDRVRARPVDDQAYASTPAGRGRASDAPAEDRWGTAGERGGTRVRVVGAGAHADRCSFPDQLQRWLREGADGLAACSTRPEEAPRATRTE